MKNFFYLSTFFIGLFLLGSCGNKNSIQNVELIPVKQTSDGDWQYVDKNGKVIISPQFAVATVFRDGLALVKTNTKSEDGNQPSWGYINQEGKFAFNTKYLRATVFSEGLAWVVSPNGVPSAINTNGEIKFVLQNAEEVKTFKEGLAAFSESDTSGVKWGFVDKEGKIVVNPQFKQVLFFSDGLCAVKNEDDKWGFIDKSGKVVINYQFSSAGNFKYSYCSVAQDEKRGAIDKEGKYIINPQYAELFVEENFFIAKVDGKYGWIDKENKYLVNPQFTEIGIFNQQKNTCIKSGKNYGYTNQDGKITINAQFDEALPFNNDIAFVRSGKNWGAIDKEGKYIINPQFADISYDFCYYIYSGTSLFDQVSTDFFNVETISNYFNFENPENIGYGKTFDEWCSKLNIDLNAINVYKYDGTFKVFDQKLINKDCAVTFFVIENSLVKERQVQDGYYSYSQKYVDNSTVVDNIGYVLNLDNKGVGKSLDLMIELEKHFNGYISEYSGTEYFKIFSKGDRKFFIGLSTVNSIIIISTNDNLQFESWKLFMIENAKDYVRSLDSSSTEEETSMEAVPAPPAQEYSGYPEDSATAESYDGDY